MIFQNFLKLRKTKYKQSICDTQDVLVLLQKSIINTNNIKNEVFNMILQDIAQGYNDYLIEKRRYFHMHPEVSTKEYNTSKIVKEELDKFGIPWRPCGMETGILATIKGSHPGKTILLRGDMDALTVQEITGVPYASINEGVMHACGHDCHTAMLLTAARILNDMKDSLCGTVQLAFQPAEEIAKGAKAMMDEGALDGVDACFAIHVWGMIEAGKISLEAGPRMASADMFNIKISGKGAHGAEPHDGIDAVVTAAAMVNNLQSIVSREIAPSLPAVVTVGTINGGTRFNVVAEDCELTGTTRCFDTQVWEQFENRMQRIVEHTAQTYRASAELVYERITPPVINDATFVALAQKSAKKIMGEDCLASKPATTGAEDFALFVREVPGAIAMLGINNPDCGAIWPNHSGKFCVDESQLLKGAMVYAQVALDFNAQ